MDLLAVCLFVILLMVSLAHFFWALGGVWPASSEPQLARMIVGIKGIKTMPPRLMSGMVGLVILLAALWPLMWRALIPYALPQGLIWAGMIGLIFIFLARGIAGFLPIMTNRHSEQPFATLNIRYFSPACLIIAAGFAILLFVL